MAKFKKYSLRFLCILSSCVCFLIAVFYPFQEFKAAVTVLSSGVNLGDYTFVTSQFVIPSNLPHSSTVEKYDTAPFRFTNDDGSTYILQKSSLYWVSVILDAEILVSKTNSFSGTWGRTAKFYLVYGGEKYEFLELGNDRLRVDLYLEGLNSSYFEILCEFSFWYDVYDSYAFSCTMTPTITNVKLTVQKLTADNAVPGYLSGIEHTLEEGNALQETENTLTTKTNSILTNILNAINKFAGLEGEESLDEMDDSALGDLNAGKDDLLGGTSAGDATGDMEVTIDTDSSNVIWDIINDFVTANSVVFGGFITLLSLGVVSLILNR